MNDLQLDIEVNLIGRLQLLFSEIKNRFLTHFIHQMSERAKFPVPEPDVDQRELHKAEARADEVIKNSYKTLVLKSKLGFSVDHLGALERQKFLKELKEFAVSLRGDNPTLRAEQWWGFFNSRSLDDPYMETYRVIEKLPLREVISFCDQMLSTEVRLTSLEDFKSSEEALLEVQDLGNAVIAQAKELGELDEEIHIYRRALNPTTLNEYAWVTDLEERRFRRKAMGQLSSIPGIALSETLERRILAIQELKEIRGSLEPDKDLIEELIEAKFEQRTALLQQSDVSWKAYQKAEKQLSAEIKKVDQDHSESLESSVKKVLAHASSPEGIERVAYEMEREAARSIYVYKDNKHFSSLFQKEKGEQLKALAQLDPRIPMSIYIYLGVSGHRDAIERAMRNHHLVTMRSSFETSRWNILMLLY